MLIPFSAGFGLYLVVKYWNSPSIRNRQPCAYLLWILITALLDIASTVKLWLSISKSNNPIDIDYAIIFTLTLGWYSSWALFFHRIWMCVYKSFLQNSLGALDMWDVCSLRSPRAGSNFWAKHRYYLGNSTFMAISWLSIFLVFWSLELWNHLSSTTAWDNFQITAKSSMLGFGLLMLALQKLTTVSESFKISAELTMNCLIMIIVLISKLILWKTKLIVWPSDEKLILSQVIRSGEVFLQLLIMNYHLWMPMRTSVNPRSKRYTVDLNLVLKDKNLFTKFEKQLKREFRIQNLNFLVSCVHYYRTVRAQGNFGIGDSFTETESDTFDMLNWLGAIGDDYTDPSKMARFINNEFCVRGAPQELDLDENISRRLSVRMKNLSNVYNYAERELFSEAFDFIKDTLANDSLIRFKRELNLPRGVQFHTDRTEGHGYGSPLLASRTQ